MLRAWRLYAEDGVETETDGKHGALKTPQITRLGRVH